MFQNVLAGIKAHKVRTTILGLLVVGSLGLILSQKKLDEYIDDETVFNEVTAENQVLSN